VSIVSVSKQAFRGQRNNFPNVPSEDCREKLFQSLTKVLPIQSLLAYIRTHQSLPLSHKALSGSTMPLLITTLVILNWMQVMCQGAPRPIPSTGLFTPSSSTVKQLTPPSLKQSPKSHLLALLPPKPSKPKPVRVKGGIDAIWVLYDSTYVRYLK
jgi:hypothetical protein